MYKDKASKHEFELLKLSVDDSRAKSIFNDMKELFDTTMLEFKQNIEKEKEKMKQAFTYVINESKEKCDKRDLNFMMSKIDKVEKLIT